MDSSGCQARPLRPGFVDADPHRFRIRVSNLPGGGTGLAAFLSTMHKDSSDWDDAETEITLHPISPGTWLSDTLILVSNAIDDEETHTNAHLRISPGPYNVLDDRTHIARLGSQVHARFSLPGAECRATATVPMPRSVSHSRRGGDLSSRYQHAHLGRSAT